jgi:hypothetical protein
MTELDKKRKRTEQATAVQLAVLRNGGNNPAESFVGK